MSVPSHSILRQVIQASSAAVEPAESVKQPDPFSTSPEKGGVESPKPVSEVQKILQGLNQYTLQPSQITRTQSDKPAATSTTTTTPGAPVPPALTGHAGHMKLLFDNAPVSMAMFDTQMRYLLANSRWLDDFKLQNVDVTGRSQYELFPTLHPGWRHVYERALTGQVVRCDRDAITHDGKSVVYRWEVRPWRHFDTTVGGVMITCARIQAPTVTPDQKQGEEDETPAKTSDALWEGDLPVLALSSHGLILRASKVASGLLLSKGLEEGKTHFSTVCGERGQGGELSRRLQQAIEGLLVKGHSQEILTTQDKEKQVVAEIPGYWLLTKISDESIGVDGPVIMAVGLTGLPMEPEAKVAVESPVPVSKSTQTQEDTTGIQLRLREAQDAERLSKQRESRLRAVLDLAPCGLLVLDERARPIYQNARLKHLLGRPLEEGQSVEDWLTDKCLDAEHREEVSRRWREGVWRKQIALSVTVSTADELLKDVEMRPVSLPGGGMMVMMQDVTEARRSEEMLRSTEAKFRVLVHENPQPVLLTDRSGAVFDANPAAENLLGYPRAELRRMGLERWLLPGSIADRSRLLREMNERGDRSGEFNAVVLASGQAEHAVTIRMAVVPDVNGLPIFTIHFLLPVPDVAPEPLLLDGDLTGSFMGENEKSDASFPAMGYEIVPLLATDAQGRIEHWSKEAEEEFGYGAEDARGRGLHLLFKPSDATGFYGELAEIVGRHDETEVDWQFFHRMDGRQRGRFLLKRSGTSLLAVIVQKTRQRSLLLDDVAGSKNERRPKQASQGDRLSEHLENAEKSLRSQRVLLGETHHRVKNHLQIITSMLNLQMSTIRNEEARDALRSSQNRIRSIASLHQHLSQLASGETADFKVFAEDLIERLRDLYDVKADRVGLDLLLPDAVVPDDWLLPLALSLNEMVSNAFKHAFPGGRPGHLRVALQWDENVGVLIVADDGIGLAPDFDDHHPTGMGLKILRVFAGQLGGEVKLSSPPGEGTEFVLHFPVDGKTSLIS